jgi:hypothetical protein
MTQYKLFGRSLAHADLQFCELVPCIVMNKRKIAAMDALRNGISSLRVRRAMVGDLEGAMDMIA